MRLRGRRTPNGAGEAAARAASSWRRVAVVFALATLTDLCGWGQLQAFTPLFLRTELGLAPDEVARWTGLLTASQLVLALPLSLFWGAVADRFGRKPVIVRSYLISAGCYLVCAASGSVEMMLLGRLVFGLAYGSQAVMAAAQSDVTPENRLAAAISLVQMMAPVGLALGPLLGGVLVNVIGLRGLFALDAGFLLCSALTIVVGFQDRADRDPRPIRAQMGQVLTQVTRQREVRGVFLTIFLLASAGSLLDSFVPVALDQLYRGPEAAAFIGVAVSVFGLMAGGCTPLAGRLADRLGRARVLGWSLLSLSAVAAAMALAPGAYVLAGLQALRGVPHAGTIGLIYPLVALVVPARQRGALMSGVSLPRNAAGFVAPLTGALLAPFGVGAVFVTAALTYLAGWLLLSRTITRPKEAATVAEPAP